MGPFEAAARLQLVGKGRPGSSRYTAGFEVNHEFGFLVKKRGVVVTRSKGMGVSQFSTMKLRPKTPRFSKILLPAPVQQLKCTPNGPV